MFLNKDKYDKLSEKMEELQNKYSQLKVEKMSLETQKNTLEEEIKFYKFQSVNKIETKVVQPLKIESQFSFNSDTVSSLDIKMNDLYDKLNVVTKENE